MNKSEQLIACLEGEIAKRDEELAACRVAVENCEVFRARIVELESRYQRDVWGLNNEGDPIGGDPAGGYANDNARLRTELAAIKAQEPIEYQLRAMIRDVTNIPEAGYYMPQSWHDQVIALSLSGKLDAPVSEAKAQGVVMPEQDGSDAQIAFWAGFEFAVCGLHNNDIRAAWNDFKSSERFKRLYAAPAAPAADAWLVEALDYQALFDAIAAATSVYANGAINISVQAFRDALAAHCAKGVV